jgi:hypothetical protein
MEEISGQVDKRVRYRRRLVAMVGRGRRHGAESTGFRCFSHASVGLSAEIVIEQRDADADAGIFERDAGVPW